MFLLAFQPMKGLDFMSTKKNIIFLIQLFKIWQDNANWEWACSKSYLFIEMKIFLGYEN